MIYKDDKTNIQVEVTGRFIDKPKLLYRKFAYNDIQPVLQKENWKLVKKEELNKYKQYLLDRLQSYGILDNYILLDDCYVYNVEKGSFEKGCALFKYNALVIGRQLELTYKGM